MIEINKINKVFGENHVLKDVSACFDSGKINLVIGQSGSGKTVLLKTIVGLYPPTDGDILYDGRSYKKYSSRGIQDIRREMGMLFQGVALFDFLNIEENVKFPLDMFTVLSEKEKLMRVNECLEMVNLSGTNHFIPAELSGGMQKRVGIARAIVLNPRYLFCDEPTSGLDPMTASVIDHLIKDITKRYKTTTLINTHDLNSVTEIGEKVLFIHNGEKWWEGTKEDVFQNENKELNQFIFSSELAKEAKNKHV